MHPQEVREEVGVVAPEVLKEFRVFVESQELTDDLDGEHFRVAQRWGGSPSSQAPEASDAVVDEAEDGHDEGAKIHESEDLLLASVGLGATERREVFSLAQVIKETCTRG